MPTNDLRSAPEMLMRSKHLAYFERHGQVFAYHNLFGYILGMSRDLVDLLEFHASDLRTRDEVDTRFAGQFEAEQLDEFIGIFKLFSCLIDSELSEQRSVWRMVPVRSRWVVFHQPNAETLTFWRTSRDGESSADPMPSWAAQFWARVDGEATVQSIVDELGLLKNDALGADPARTLETQLAAWVNVDRQYLKLAKAPVRKFGPEHQWPSYLRSTMPYEPFNPYAEAPPTPLDELTTPINPPHEYYEAEVEDAERQFEDVETTLSHLFRESHPLLGGARYADRVVDALIERSHLDEQTTHIMEVGAGMGHFACGVLERIRERLPGAFEALRYTIVDLAPALRAEQERRLREAGLDTKVQWVAANAELVQLEPESVDLLLCNEVVGDFSVVKLTRELIGMDQTMDPAQAAAGWSEETRTRLGEAGRLIETYVLPLRDAPEEFFLNTGAMAFVETVAAALRPGGSAWITEYGEPMKYPIASTQLDHLEFSIHFGHLHHVAKALGLASDIAYVQELIGLDRSASTLETTRTYFSSLVAMLGSFGLTLDKRAWTREMFDELLGDAVALEHLGDIRFRAVDERCMGLAPHEFKALLLKKPVA